jgi:uncharacterized protein YjbI with pentapeptide repeats
MSPDPNLRKADFTGAQLQGAHLDDSDLREAKFDCPHIRAFLIEQCARLRGAFLFGAKLQGASLDRAQLQGASLDSAHLQGASLKAEELTGGGPQINLHQGGVGFLRGEGPQLQGASLEGAHLEGASLADAFAWRADARTAAWKDTRVVDQETGPKYPCERNDELAACDWSAESFEKLKQMIAEATLPISSTVRQRVASISAIFPNLDSTAP